MKNNRSFIYSLSAAMVMMLAAGSFSLAQAADMAKEKGKAKGPSMNIMVSPYKERPEESAKTVAQGKVIYQNSCIYCHGNEGEGDGSVAFYLSRDTAPRPRDFTSGIYKFRSTYSGELPMDEDIFRTITRGVVGFMPGFEGMTAEDRWKVTYYLKSLYPDFKSEKPEAIKIVGLPIPITAGSVHKGYKVYTELKCWECHGGGGRGDGKKAPGLKDDWDMPLPPRDMTRLNTFKNGSEDIDIYRSIMGGLDGGAMPSYSDTLEGEEEKAWHLVNYIRALSQ